jgi:hypothetical protein
MTPLPLQRFSHLPTLQPMLMLRALLYPHPSLSSANANGANGASKSPHVHLISAAALAELRRMQKKSVSLVHTHLTFFLPQLCKNNKMQTMLFGGDCIVSYHVWDCDGIHA